MKIHWKGVYPALTTPFTEDDRIDYAVFEKNLHAQRGVAAIMRTFMCTVGT